MRRTCPKSEYLEVDDFINELAKDVLSNEELIEAEKISQDISKKSTRISAIRDLKNKVGDRPKRPI
ncbi:MAG: hypothetical protein ABFC24_03805, partial [Methanoregulaceae archaeon]